ncbi:hypothetical protein B9Z55_013151 [Caenorhabditis nigoni]|uniref:Uncharacterized protein n=1 Tax=Caenorhabditis nigoni TaxID=1611254 RepID=A0A2G5U0X3_9PELO|nr:hypothetical protein B9Z55_013151 [Caenorhabditis nigoni]
MLIFVICDDLEVRNVDSFGRKKRSSNVEKWLKSGQKKETRKRRMVIGTLTITDEETRETVKPRPEFSTSSTSSSSQQFCVQKDRIELVVVIVVVLILLQIGLALFFYKKCVARSVSDTSSSVYSEGSSECSATSSAYNTCNRQMIVGQGPVLPARPSRFSDGAPFTENPYNRLHHFT